MRWLLALLLVAAASAQSSLASWEVTPAHAALGEPIECRLTVIHDGAANPFEPNLDLDYAWEVIDGPDRESTADGTAFVWTVMAFEAGEIQLPAIDVRFEGGDRLRSASKAVTVEGVLRAGEDEPRPGPGFRTVEERTSPVRPMHVGLLIFVLMAAGFAWWWHARQPGEPPPVRTEWDRFQQLTEEEPVAVAVQLSGLLRVAFDRRSGLDRSALTDEEWLADVDRDVANDLRDVLADCESIKFGGDVPSRLGMEDLKKRAGVILKSLRDQYAKNREDSA